MTKFKQIIQLRNQGKTQEEIANILGISRRSVIRYLNNGQIPVYKKKWCSRTDPMTNYYQIAEDKLKQCPKLLLDDLFEYIQEKGYTGSFRTLRRKTEKLRSKLKNKEIFFQREVKPGEIMEGDFTSLILNIGGKQRWVHIWVVTLPYSNAAWATPYYHQTFECFADGSEQAFRHFNGVAEKYRLDNFSAVVTKILLGHDRIITKRYAEFQEHYNFKQDFCNPAKGNEKGNVENNNRHLKARIFSRKQLKEIQFKDLEAVKFFIWDLCLEHNKKISVKFNEEELQLLPDLLFPCYSTAVVKISKYSMFTYGSGYFYSAPSEYIGMRLEARIYHDKIELIYDGKIVCSHSKLHGKKGLSSVLLEHVIAGLCKKPNAINDWKHKNILLDNPIWIKFYEKIKEKNLNPQKHYLLCLNLITKYNRGDVTAAMEIILENNLDANTKTLSDILDNNECDIVNIKPLNVDLNVYDNILNLAGGVYAN